MTIEMTSSPTFNLLLSTAPTPCTIKDSLVEKLNLFSFPAYAVLEPLESSTFVIRPTTRRPTGT